MTAHSIPRSAPTSTRATLDSSRGRRAIVIGAGLGGLATAARLGHAGYRVTVLERHAVPGGRAGLWESEGFRFDTGPSLVLMVDYWQQLFRDVGRRLDDYVTLVQLDPNYRIHYPDGSTLEITSRMNALLENVERIEPGATPGMLRFLAKSGELYRKGLSFIDRNMHTARSMFSVEHASMLLGTGALGGLRSMVSKYVRDERLRDALTFQSLYLGLSPYESLAIYSLLPYTEIAGGLTTRWGACTGSRPPSRSSSKSSARTCGTARASRGSSKPGTRSPAYSWRTARASPPTSSSPTPICLIPMPGCSANRTRASIAWSSAARWC